MKYKNFRCKKHTHTQNKAVFVVRIMQMQNAKCKIQNADCLNCKKKKSKYEKLRMQKAGIVSEGDGRDHL